MVKGPGLPVLPWTHRQQLPLLTSAGSGSGWTLKCKKMLLEDIHKAQPAVLEAQAADLHLSTSSCCWRQIGLSGSRLPLEAKLKVLTAASRKEAQQAEIAAARENHCCCGPGAYIYVRHHAAVGQQPVHTLGRQQGQAVMLPGTRSRASLLKPRTCNLVTPRV